MPSVLGGGHDHSVCDAAGAGDENAESEARKDVGVIDLRDGDHLAVDLDGGKRAAGADERAAVGPVEQIGGRGFETSRWDWRAGR